MPKHPIYIPLLPESVKEVIGEPHEKARPAMKILCDEGFVKTNMVDIFDSGPQIRAPKKGIRAVNETREARIAKVISKTAPTPKPKHVIAKRDLQFRACLGTVDVNPDGSVNVTEEIAKLIEASKDDNLLYTPIYMATLNR